MTKKLLLVGALLIQVWISTAQTNVNLQSSNLPIFIINTKGGTIVNDPKIKASLRVIYNGKGQLNRITDKNYHYNNYIGIELRGNSSQGYPQQQYGFETKDSVTSDNLDATLLDMPADNDWVLYAPYNDVSMLRNVLIYKLWNQMDHWGPRTKFCEVIINGDYKGIYILIESIKRGDNRVDAAKLADKDTVGLDVTGGYIMKIDKNNNASDKSFVSKFKSVNNTDVAWLYHYPKSKDIHPKQEAYIHRYIDSTETAIFATHFKDPVQGYAKYISTQSFIDYLILTEFTNNADAYKSSAFFYKEKKAVDGIKGKLKAGPVWDYNLALGNVSFCNGAAYTGWTYNGCNPATMPMTKIWQRLMEDPSFANQVKCRYLAFRKNLLNVTNINKFLDSYATDTLAQAQVRHFTRWKILGTNPGFFNAYVVNSYSEEMQKIKTWISNRLGWMDANLGGTCITTALEEGLSSTEQKGLEAYPNPFSEGFSVSSPSLIFSLQIFDTQGRLVYSKEGIKADKVNLGSEMGSLAPGMYALRCATSTGTQVKMVYKRH